MITKQATIKNRTGLHARPASDFVIEAKKYEAKISIRNLSNNRDPVNAKSIMRLLAEGIMQGTDVEITAEGADERQACEALVSLIETGFGEL
jgi:phosphocarrier protein HPr